MRVQPKVGTVIPATLERRRDGLFLQLKGLIHVRALLELRGATPAELAEHTHQAIRVRTELARLAPAQATVRGEN